MGEAENAVKMTKILPRVCTVLYGIVVTNAIRATDTDKSMTEKVLIRYHIHRNIFYGEIVQFRLSAIRMCCTIQRTGDIACVRKAF